VLGDNALALRRHLPRPSGVDPGSWVASPGAGADAAVKVLDDESASAARLAGLSRALVPHLLVRWWAHLQHAPLSDRGVARALGHAHADLLAMWHEGEDLLQALLRAGPDSAAPVGRVVTAIEGHLATLQPVSSGRIDPLTG
jgi:hypothetical protein